ncbi:inosine/xanthosine triphosphatase [Methanocella sp. CWC-04]|uniref:Probable inosine/xanthosine triphosphatase n=1 Tax=Methanooceanicella nereidis TaxID=2052831 RepID=A0AAP2W7S7_9EURY|nr:inosine/xanthosine triphosphatase [Methanocella sp. CWC-04]
MRIAVGTNNPVKVNAAENVFSSVFGDVTVDGINVPSGVPSQPFGNDTVKGAMNRAKNAYESGRYDYGVGIEAGLFDIEGYVIDVQYCAIFDGQWTTIGCGSGFEYPSLVLDEVLSGKEVGEVMSKFTGIDDLGKKMGAIGYLSNGMLDRTRLTEQSVFMALIPRMNKELYKH